MKKLAIGVIVFALILPWIVATSARAADPTPTPPPPPSKPTETKKPPKPPNKTKTPTPTQKPGGPWYTVTPSPTATLEESLTPSVTPSTTLRTGPTITPTATPIPTYLEIQVYMDANENRQFDMGEGVEDLVVVATAATWQSWVTTRRGKVTFLLPPTMAKDTAIDVEIPYLHWSLVVKAPDTGATARGELQLALPEYPVFLP